MLDNFFIEWVSCMNDLFAKRITAVPRSFIREILKVSLDPDIISFAGGLPNKRYFPVAEIQAAANQVFAEIGATALQYSNSEGLLELRELIAKRYREKKGIAVEADSIIITNGSQQGLDLLGKVLVNTGDNILIEEPGYLGAIQALSVYQPNFHTVEVGPGGMNTSMLAEKCVNLNAKLLYTVPNFQNPSGVTYSEHSRQQVAEIAGKNNFLLIEDDPYGELRFTGEAKKNFYSYAPEQTVLLGSFSKIVAPGFRIGWMVAPKPLLEKLLVVKQAADLHTASVSQYILCRYLKENDLDEHVETIIHAYGNQCRVMLDAVRRYLPQGINWWEPEGGMFLWGELPKGYDSMTLFDFAVREKVVFVPGKPFFIGNKGENTFRLNFSCSEPEEIEMGIQRLSRAFSAYAAHLANER